MIRFVVLVFFFLTTLLCFKQLGDMVAKHETAVLQITKKKNIFKYIKTFCKNKNLLFSATALSSQNIPKRFCYTSFQTPCRLINFK